MGDLQARNLEAYERGLGKLAESEAAGTDILEDLFGIRTAPGEILVDVGCGNGAYLAALPCRKVGIDLSPRNLRIAATRVPGGLFVAGSALRMPLRAGSVDAVLLAAILHHLPDFRLGLLEEARVLRPGGRLFVLEANGGGLAALRPLTVPFNWVRKAAGRYPWHEERAGTIHVREILGTLTQIGLEIEVWRAATTFLKVLGEAAAKRLGRIGAIVLGIAGRADRAVGPRLRRESLVYQYIAARKSGGPSSLDR